MDQVFFRYFIIFLLPLAASTAHSQHIKALSVALMDEDVALPFSQVSPIHPGFEIGALLRMQEKEYSINMVSISIGGYYHKKLETAFYLKGEFSHTLKIGRHFGLELPIALGYLHSIYPSQVYRVNEKGDFVESNTVGRSQFLVDLGLGISYRNGSNWQPFIRHHMMLETPFSTFFPIMPHTFIRAGMRFQIPSQKAKKDE